MNLGTENRKKTMAAAILGVLAVLFIGYRMLAIFGGGGSPDAAANAAANVPMSQTATPRRSTPRRPAASGAKKAAPAPSLDPTLKLSLLAASENTKYTGNGRNIFRAEEDIPKPIAPPVKVDQAKTEPPPPPPPPPINLKFFGFASKPGEAKRIFLSKGEDVFIAGEGDIVDRRYKVLQIGPASVTIQDVLTNNTQQIPLTQG